MLLAEDENGARQYLERIRWPAGAFCARCGERDRVYKLESDAASTHRLRHGVYKCGNCRRRFTVTVGTILEGTHISLQKWLRAFQRMRISKKGASALEIQRELALGSYRSAWFLCRRIQWALAQTEIKKEAGDDEAIRLLLQLKPTASMPRPGANRQRSVWAQVDEELHGRRPAKKAGHQRAMPRSHRLTGRERF
jgi:transposase-like protein